MATDKKLPARSEAGEAAPLVRGSVEDPLEENHAARSIRETELMGYFLIMLSASVFACTNFLNRAAMSLYDVPAAVTFFIRGIMQILLCFAYAAVQMRGGTEWRTAIRRTMSDRSGAFVLLYGLLSAVYIVLLIAALERLPVSLVSPITYSNSAFALLLAYFLRGERFGLLEMCAVALSLGGVVLISHPSSPSTIPTTTTHPHQFTSPPLPTRSHVTGCVMAAVSAFVSASAFTSLRFLPPYSPPVLAVFSAVIMLTILSIPLGGAVTPTKFMSYGLGASIAVFANALAFLPMLLLTKGFQMCRSGPGTIVLTVGVPVACFLGIGFLGESLTWMQILGTVMIITATVVIGCREFFYHRN